MADVALRDYLQTSTQRKQVRHLLALRALAGVALALLSGCSLFERCSMCKSTEPPPSQSINYVLTIWDQRVFTTADTQHPGQMLTGLAGRVYLSSDEHKRMEEAKGHIFVEMYDVTTVPNGGEPRKIVDWNFDPISLKQLKREDKLGDGYTLFLPWDTYRPDIKQVKLQLAYVEPNGTPHYSEPTTVTLKSHEPVAIQQQQVVPAMQVRGQSNQNHESTTNEITKKKS